MKSIGKKLLATSLIFTTLFAFASNSSAYTRHINTNSTYAMEIDGKYIGSGSYTGKVGVENLAAYPSGVTPQINEVLAYSGYTILNRTFSTNRSATKDYTIAGVTFVKFTVENYSSQPCTLVADVKWEYDC